MLASLSSAAAYCTLSLRCCMPFTPAARPRPLACAQVAGLALKQQHSFIDTIGEEDSATNVQARARCLAQ